MLVHAVRYTGRKKLSGQAWQAKSWKDNKVELGTSPFQARHAGIEQEQSCVKQLYTRTVFRQNWSLVKHWRNLLYQNKPQFSRWLDCLFLLSLSSRYNRFPFFTSEVETDRISCSYDLGLNLSHSQFPFILKTVSKQKPASEPNKAYYKLLTDLNLRQMARRKRGHTLDFLWWRNTLQGANVMFHSNCHCRRIHRTMSLGPTHDLFLHNLHWLLLHEVVATVIFFQTQNGPVFDNGCRVSAQIRLQIRCCSRLPVYQGTRP